MIRSSLPFKIKTDLLVLALTNIIVMSERTVKRRFSDMGLFRLKFRCPLTSVARYTSNVFMESVMQHGYRWMHQRCILNGFQVSRSYVAGLMHILDPAGMVLRKGEKKLWWRQYYAKGPNYLWHIDSCDKLKHYGICINGCIDGYSRKIIWCEATCSSSVPRIVVGHFVKEVDSMRDCPKTVRGDFGTENRHVAEFQGALREQSSFIYGGSTGNQKIKAFWRQLRNGCCQFWIELFGHFKDNGNIVGDIVDTNLIQFLFMSFIQKDINEAISVWHFHSIRPTRNTNGPAGKPCILYTTPELEDTVDFAEPFNDVLLEICRSLCFVNKNVPSDPDLTSLFHILIAENNFQFPGTVDEACDFYVAFRNMVNFEIRNG